MARASERLGFFDLPREIRDEIYRMSFSKSYTLRNGGSLGGHNTIRLIRRPTSGGPTESHILQISQRMSFEAEEILFSDGTFCLHLSESDRQSLSRELADRFMNLCIYIPLRIFYARNLGYNYQMLETFGGARVGRKTCTINFIPQFLEYWVPDTRLFSVLKTFTGFKTVRIQIPNHNMFSPGRTWQMRDNMRPMRESLECALGHAIEFEDSNTRGLEFHPQDRASAHNA